MLSIGNKTFMNLQEAVGWLLENNALPYQSTANYAGGVEIAMSTLINPSPAKVRVGSIIFFADSKVSTVVGVTSNSFIVSDQYNDLVDDVVYVSNVAINASGHLIVTLSNGEDIDAGLIKQVSNFSIDSSQHLIVTYNDGSTTDLGAIFSGNVNIAGNLTANSIIENMSGYGFTKEPSSAVKTLNYLYAGVVKNGNKVTITIFLEITRLDNITGDSITVGNLKVPYAIWNSLYPAVNNWISFENIYCASDYNVGKNIPALVTKINDGETLRFVLYNVSQLTLNTKYYVRFEKTFLLSQNLAA